jgi:SH3 domain protein
MKLGRLMQNKHLLLILLMAASNGVYAHISNENPHYITDSVDIPLRLTNSIQSKPSNLLRLLPSDTQLKLLSTDSGWTKVEIGDGTIGWVVSRYITTKTPAKVALKEVVRLNVKLKKELEFTTNQCSKYRTDLEVL